MNALQRASTIMQIPDNWFSMMPNIVSKDAQDVAGECNICGTLKPITCANGYMRRQCEHQARARYAATNQHGEQPISNRAYSWLGLRIVDDLADKTFDNFHPEHQPDKKAYRKHLADARMYAGQIVLRQRVDNLLLVGTVGTGKTHIAAAILNHLRQHHISCLFCTAKRLFRALSSANFDEQRSIIDQASSTPLLVIDDIDKIYIKAENGGAYQKGILLEILDERYLRKLPTIITTNEQADLTPWLDVPTMSRLGEHLTGLEMNGVDYRARGKQ